MKSYIIILAAVLFVSCFGLPCFAACPSADLTGDCFVDFEDINALTADWLNDCNVSNGWCDGADITQNGTVNLSDFAVSAEQWLTEGSYTLNVNSSSVAGVSISSSTGHDGITNYTQTLLPETSVSLTAPATVNNLPFIGWTGDVNSSNQTISFQMNGDKTVTANYLAEPTGMEWVNINDPCFNGQMSKYETTNAQYCLYLNAAKDSNQITVHNNKVYAISDTNYVQPYYDLAGAGLTEDGATNGGAARINYVSGVFTTDMGFENHPVTYVSWYGATTFCSQYGYRLPTESEWQAVADYDGSYTYGCGTTINNSKANYYGSTHPNGTTIVGDFGTYGYGMCDMAGNVEEWTSSLQSGSYPIIRGGCWEYYSFYCTVSFSIYNTPTYMYRHTGFRVCR